MFSTAFGAVGDVTTIIDQKFAEGTTLADTDAYTWGSDIQGMITSNGIYVTNNDKVANNYENRPFLSFVDKNGVGSATNLISISYEVYNPKDKGQANTNYDINYFNPAGEFIFGIREKAGEWKYGADIIVAKEDGTTETLVLKPQLDNTTPSHMTKGGGSVVSLTIKFSDNLAIIDIDGGSYSAYTKTSGIKDIKLSVSGERGYDRDMYVKNYTLKTKEVQAAQFSDYTVKVVEGSNVLKEEIKSGEVGSTISLTSTDTADFFNDEKSIKYIYVSNNAEGQTIKADGSTVVTITFRQADVYNYTVKADVDDVVIATGKCFEKENATVPYHRYIVKSDATIWKKEPCGGEKKLEYNYTFTPTSDGQIEVLSYSEVTDKGKFVWFAEAEDLADKENPYYVEGIIPTSNNNANVRCSNGFGAYANESVDLYTLKPGTYIIYIAGMGGHATDDSKNVNFIVNVGEKTFTKRTTGSWFETSFDEFPVKEETKVSFEGANGSHQFDYILITGTVDVGGIAINGKDGNPLETLNLAAGSEYQLNAVITPTEASNKTVTWTSSNPEVATVDETGKVKAVKGGEVTITAKSNANEEIIASVTVNVNVPATGLEIQDKDKNTLENGSELKLTVGDNYTLTAVKKPADATDKVTWESSNTEVATVDANGVIKALKAGETTITAKLAGFSVAIKAVVAEASVPVTGIKLDKSTADMKTGATLQLTATIEPENATSKNVEWTSSDAETATVDQNGLVNAVKAGTVTITATANGFSTTCAITITDIAVTGISLDKPEIKDLKIGETVKLTATVEPENATDQTVTWSTSDEEVVSVDQEGNVTGVAAGTATITATAGEMSATCEITVIIPVEGIKLSYSEVGLFEGTSHKLVATVEPSNATDSTVTWTSSNEEVATVEAGEVKAIAEGEAIITATAGEKTAKCKIIVKAKGIIPTEGIVIDQTFNSDTTLEHTDKYIWGPDVKGMITANGIYLTNNDNAANSYEKKDFITFSNAIGSESQKLDISHSLKFENNRAQTPTYFNIKYFNEDNHFVFGIQGVNGSDSGKDYLIYANVVIANENGELTTSKLFDFEKTKWKDLDLSVTFSGTTALVTIGDNSYNAYTSTPGIKNVNLSVVGPRDWSRGFYLNKLAIKTTEVEVVKLADYTLDYVCNGESIKKEKVTGVVGSEIILTDDQKANFYNDDETVKYIYVNNDLKEGTQIASDGSTVVTLTYREADIYNYTVKSNLNTVIATGSVFEGESATVPFSRYILDNDGTVWMKSVGNTSSYIVTVKPDKDNYVYTLDYTPTDMTDGIFFKEAEDEYYKGVLTPAATAGNRGSNYKGGYGNGVLYTLEPGSYKFKFGALSSAKENHATLKLKAGEKEILSGALTDNKFNEFSTEAAITVSEETELSIEGTDKNNVLDYILITGTVGIPATKITINRDGNAVEKNLEITLNDDCQLSAAVEPEASTDEVIWSSSDETVANVDQTGKVTALKVGKTTITATAGKATASCEVKVFAQQGDVTWNGSIDVTDATDITNYVVGKKTADEGWDAAEWDEFYKKAADVNNDKNITFADASATISIVLDQKKDASTQNRISAYHDDSMDALVIGRVSASSKGSVIPVTLDNTEAYVALQADIFLPEGMNVDVKEGSRIADSHTMLTKKHADNHIRVVIFNLGNKVFADNDAPILEIVTDSYVSASDIAISTIIASDTDANGYVLASRAADTNGVAAIGLDPEAPVKVFDVNGIYVGDTMEGLQQGTYIVRQGEVAKTVRVR